MSKAMTKQELDTTDLDTPSKRLTALREALDGSIRLVQRAAHVLHAMIEAGDDVSSLPTPLRNWLSRIYARQVLAEVFTELSGTLRVCVARLPLAEQQRIVDGTTLPLLVSDGDRTDELNIDPRKMMPEQVKQVFANGYIRDLAQQRAYLASQSTSQRRVKLQVQGVTIDKKRKGVCFGNQFYPASQVVQWLAALT